MNMKEKSTNEEKILHVYGQEMSYEPVDIVGNRKALEALRDAIDEALDGHVEESMFKAKQNDGARYIVTVRLVDDDEAKSLESAYFWS